MIIKLTPINTQRRLEVSKQGDILTLNGEDFDFSGVTEGSTLPKDAITSYWIVSDVTRESGQLELTIMLPHGDNAPEATRFPAPIINPADGNITLPAYNEETV